MAAKKRRSRAFGWEPAISTSSRSRPIDTGPGGGVRSSTFPTWTPSTPRSWLKGAGHALSVASYGKQLGRIGDALIVLLKHVDLGKLSPDGEAAIRDLKAMLNEIANKKEKHGAKLVLRP